MRPGDIVINPNFREGAKSEYFQKFCLIEEIIPHKQRKGGLAARLVGIHSREFLTHASLEVLVQAQNNYTAMSKQLITRKQLAQELKVSIPTVDRWIRDRVVPFYRQGRKVFFDLEEVRSHRSGYGELIKVDPIQAQST